MSPTDSGSRYGGPEWNAVRGYTFTVNRSGLEAVQLGIVNLIDQDLTLSLFNVTTGDLLAQKTLNYSGAGTQAWQFVDLDTAIDLDLGGTYFVGVYADNLSYYSNIMIDNALLPQGDISYVAMNYCNFCSADTLPTATLDQSIQGLVDIGYQIRAVPAPASLGILGAGLIGFAALRRRKA